VRQIQARIRTFRRPPSQEAGGLARPFLKVFTCENVSQSRDLTLSGTIKHPEPIQVDLLSRAPAILCPHDQLSSRPAAPTRRPTSSQVIRTTATTSDLRQKSALISTPGSLGPLISMYESSLPELSLLALV
jgi:hypothetical protein